MILFCNGVVLVIYAAAAFLGAGVLWHVTEPVREFLAACVDHGPLEDDEDCPDCDDPTAEWDRGHDQWMDRELGVSW